jgi:hypothetical protein
MKLEQQVCSLDLARRLKELGVKQESYFWWIEILSKLDSEPTGQFEIWDRTMISEFETGHQNCHVASAFTVAELGEMLPAEVEEKKIFYWKRIWGSKTDWYAGVLNEVAWVEAETEADARAKMLIYLLENKLITL